MFIKKSWMGPGGQTVMIPKEEGHGVMMSSFVSIDYGFNIQLSPKQLKIVNTRRKGDKYKDVDAATMVMLTNKILKYLHFQERLNKEIQKMDIGVMKIWYCSLKIV